MKVSSILMCDYQARQHSHLKVHEKSVREGVKYSCSMCDYQATTQSNLKRHEKFVQTITEPYLKSVK